MVIGVGAGLALSGAAGGLGSIGSSVVGGLFKKKRPVLQTGIGQLQNFSLQRTAAREGWSYTTPGTPQSSGSQIFPAAATGASGGAGGGATSLPSFNSMDQDSENESSQLQQAQQMMQAQINKTNMESISLARNL